MKVNAQGMIRFFVVLGASVLLLSAAALPATAAAGPDPCSVCHGNGFDTVWPDGADSPDRAGRHLFHLQAIAARLGYTPDPPWSHETQLAMCAYCHVNPSGPQFDAVHNTGQATQVTGYIDALWTVPNVSFESVDTDAAYTPGTDDSCTNVDCHNRKTAAGATWGWYGSDTGTCLLCHTPGGGVGAIADPTDGLHDNAPAGPTTTGVAHDDLFAETAGCATCHTVPAIGPTSTHMTNGLTPADTTANVSGDFYVTLVGYADPEGSCSGAFVATGCHDGAGERGGWARRWSTTAYNTNGLECANCHGGLGANDWTFGRGTHNTTDGHVEHHYSWDGDALSEVIGNHSGTAGLSDKCNLCHVYAYSGVYSTNAGGHIGWAGNAANISTYHGDQSLSMNSHSTIRYNSTNYGCDGGACHAPGTSSHHLEDSGWNVRIHTNGPQAACFSCHGNFTGAGSYWPDTPNNTSTPDRAGRHTLHITKLAVKLNYTSPFTDAQQKTMCAYCHENPMGPMFPQLHANGAVQVSGYVDALWTVPNVTFESADADATYTPGTADSCANFDCHNRKTAAGTTWGWYGSDTATCLLCHTPGGGAGGIADPTDGLHDNAPGPGTTGVAHDDLFAGSAGCVTCHTVPAIASTSTHMTNGLTPADTTANVSGDFYVTLVGYADPGGSCSGAFVSSGCHDGAGEMGSWARLWSTTAYSTNGSGAECANCHGGFNGNDWTFGKGEHNPNDGNVEHQYDWDGDGTSQVIGNHTASAAPDRCDLCHVWSTTPVYSTNAGGRIGWAGNAASQSVYHGDGRLEMNAHSSAAYNSANYGCDAGVCHAAGSGPQHLESGLWPLTMLYGPGAPPVDVTAPALAVTSHANDDVVTTAAITLAGTASDAGRGDSGIQRVRVDGVDAAGGTATGSATANWSREVSLGVGSNLLAVTAWDDSPLHNSAGLTITIVREDSAETIATPSQPAGPVAGCTFTDYGFTGSGASSNLGHAVEYRLAWSDAGGDHSTGWSGDPAAGIVFTDASPEGGTVLRSEARCAQHPEVVSAPGAGLVVAVTDCLGAALDKQARWQSGGDAFWSRQTGQGFDDDFAHSGEITDGQYSAVWLDLAQPACLGFSWKVSSERKSDYLTCLVNDEPHLSISGEMGWRSRTIAAPAGRIEWRYARDASGSAGADRGLLDHVFTNKNKKMLTLFKPNGNAVLQRGRSYRVEWRGCGPIARVNLVLLKNGVKRIVARGTANDGVARWAVPFSQAPGSFRLCVEATDDPAVTDCGFEPITIQ